ncbi:hypothetical protein [Aliarcobacter cryaerophilus]|uniref:hypothetical protein n=1 Tax=Aliarcobacter cryaerophilus TaxID=28198 RepID=UPI0021B18624|nr:hypothetical protein [Aliarcobacter cryaerophilus]MCT7445573.1 hypothetical protein [Aliarcobacter cryaerophilus]MCT7480513.1 hypothetical protein [Aliarcobacter cryaerophilus]
MKIKKDFNSIFWGIIGVNNRVFEVEDIFKKTRDKQADEKKYDNFLKNNSILSNKQYFNFVFKELYTFDELLIGFLFTNNEENRFYVNQIHNITMNYKTLLEKQFDETLLINLLSFQISYIIEYMAYNNIDITVFDECLLKKSIKPVIDACIKSTEAKSLKVLALKLSHKNSDIKEYCKVRDIEIDDVTADTFQKDLSNWKNNKSLPSFIKLLVITNIIHKQSSRDKTAFLIQLILIRSLLYIQKKFNVQESSQLKFLKKVKYFRDRIKKNYLKNTLVNITEEQSRYVIDFSNYFNDLFTVDTIEQFDIEKHLKEIKNKLSIFNQYNDGDKSFTAKIPHKTFIFNEFKKCKTHDDYLELLDKLPHSLNDQPYDILIKQRYFMLLFFIAIKTNDQKIFTKYFKLFDKSLASTLSLAKVDKKISTYNILLKDIYNIEDCRKIFVDYLEKYQL